MPAPAPLRGLVRRLWLPALAAFVVWHTIFDLTIRRGMERYLAEHARHAAGQGPAVTIHGVMDEAVRTGALAGLAGAVLVFALVAGGRRIIARRRLRSD